MTHTAEGLDAFRRLMAPLPEATLLLTEDGGVLAANAAAREVLGVTPSELEGRALVDLVADPPEEVSAVLRRWRHSGEFLSGPLRWRQPDGGVLECHCEGAVLDAEATAPLILVRCSAEDRQTAATVFLALNWQIAELAQELRLARHSGAERARLLAAEQASRQEAEAANRAKDEFLAVLSHELRTPLTAMLGWVRLLRTRPLEDSQRARALETIERNVRLQSQLINDLLDVSRIVSGKLELDRYRVDLVPLVDEAVESLRTEAGTKGVALDIQLEPAEVLVVGDPMRLQQIVTNLVTNAVKFTPDGGRVEVRLAQHGARARITVTDTGEGIEPALLPYIFDRFRQADARAARRHGGLGLGLAIVRTLVTLHGGTVAADSAGPGRGATFTVELPIMAVRLQLGEKTGAGAELVESSAPRLEGRTILVVDDDADARELVRLVLTQSGGTVLLATSVDQAVELLGRGPLDLLLSDLAMPREDGYALVRRVRELERREGRPTMPAVALSAHAGVAERQRAIAAGFHTHLVKPIDPIELVEVIAKTLAGLVPHARPSAGRARDLA